MRQPATRSGESPEHVDDQKENLNGNVHAAAYFPQGALAGKDEGRYRKFKMAVFAILALLLLFIVGIGVGVWYLLRSLF